ncbi:MULTISPECIES: hypothetical protein [Pseudomonas]|uniref:hypothetical protein n=1 Tax=Pseudomonas TaxID=286 RepID=UPI000C521FBB|nr:hypothetical protein [Pseudomonadaceae bacterium]|tara:strand:- start:367 stop:546 length:180 start_codon:yes stop_codon:yes gene_type:complete
MSESNARLLVLKGYICDLPEDDQKKIFAVRDEIKAITARGDLALLGFSLASAEVAVELE